MSVELIVVGGSWGGLAAACGVLAVLPSPLPVPLVLVLHRAPDSDARVLREMVLRCSGQHLVEVEDKMTFVAGAVHIAPPSYHLLIDDGACALTTDGPVNFARPSIDLAFDSAADEYAGALAAVLLSGTGHDGVAGIRRVGDRGGRTYVQSPGSAERGEMPLAAIRSGSVDAVGAPEELGHRLAMALGAGSRLGTRAREEGHDGEGEDSAR